MKKRLPEVRVKSYLKLIQCKKKEEATLMYTPHSHSFAQLQHNPSEFMSMLNQLKCIHLLGL